MPRAAVRMKPWGSCVLPGVTVYVGLILVPAWQAYSRVWERLAATFLTLYVVAAFMLVGVLLGAAVVWTYDRWAGTG